jgi:hypothetical protein
MASHANFEKSGLDDSYQAGHSRGREDRSSQKKLPRNISTRAIGEMATAEAAPEPEMANDSGPRRDTFG